MTRKHLLASAATAAFFVAGFLTSFGSVANAAPAELYVSPGGGVLNTAYHAVADGGTVYLNDGVYGGQTIGCDTTKTGTVTFRPAPGANPSVGTLRLGDLDRNGICDPSGVQLVNLRVSLPVIDGGVGNVLDGVFGKSLYIDPNKASDTLVLGGSYGPCNAAVDTGCVPIVGGLRTQIDGAWFHDQTSSDPARFHPDGMFVRGCHSCTFRNPVFLANDVTNIRFQNCCVTTNDSITVTGGYFGLPKAGNSAAIDVDNPVTGTGLLIEDSVFEYGNGPAPASGTRLVNNKMRYEFGPCPSGVTFTANLAEQFSPTWGNQLCGTDQWATAPWMFTPPPMPVYQPPPAPTPPPTTTEPTTSTTPTTTTEPTTTAPTTTTEPTTTAPTTTTEPTTTTTPAYNPTCAPTCDEQIAALKQENNRLGSIIDRARDVLNEK